MPVVIEVRALHKRYRDGTHAVRGVDFDVQRGEIFGLLGPNGAGKTTAMHVLGTLHPPSAGRVRVLGLDPVRDAARLRSRIGFAMQDVGMDDLATAQEMLRLHAGLYGIPRQEARRRARELLGVFGLADHAARRVTRFSGGMQRRLDLAVSIIHDPEVLFLDEPSTGLDPTSRAELWKTLRRLRKQRGLTIVMSTHYMEEADALCDRVAIVDGGRIVALGTPTELRRSVGADMIRVELQAPATPTQKKRIAAALGPESARFEDGLLWVRVKDGARALVPTLRALMDAGVVVAAARVVSPTLDDVFLHYTGTRIGEAEKQAATGEKTRQVAT